MARPKTEYRNEVKSRVTDRTWEAVQRYMQMNRCASEARAISELLEIALFGFDGNVPEMLVGSGHQVAFRGPEMTGSK